ncbi:MAG: ImmA/IrrE family metallo-endopeptidase [Gammaproteobacteria bacterium]|nr:ImmA/IrrE family metallo-endopeptidase [Gammaproteobacteria bacterium]
MTQACLQLPIVEANRAGRFLADWRETRSAVALRPGACSGYLVITTPIAEGEKFDGLQASIAEQPVIVVAEQWPGDRQRFTLAHELGHLLLGGRLSAELNEEQACNRFAGAFLLPASTLRNQLGAKRHMLEIQELYLLKHEFGLSMAACLYRAKDLGIITPQTHKRLSVVFSKQGWRKQEPVNPCPQEQALLFQQLVYRALNVIKLSAAPASRAQPADFVTA